MKLMFIIITGVLISFTALSQSCLPEGITFSTQAQIDSFQVNYPGCTEIEGNVTISGNYITNLNGLNMLTSIGGNLVIQSNYALTNLSGLEELTSLINLSIDGNNELTDLAGLQGLYSIAGFVTIMGNSNLTGLSGLNNLASIGEHLEISGNASLTSLTGLSNLDSIGTLFQIYDNDLLTSLARLEGLVFIGGSLHIYHNDALLSLTGLDNVNGSSIDALYIMNNFALGICEAQCICDFFANPEHGNYEIIQNSNGCNSPEEVEAACGVGLYDQSASGNQFSISPNPAFTHTIIEISTSLSQFQISIFNLNGQELLRQSVTDPVIVIDIAHLPAGVYVVRLMGEKMVGVEKFVKID